MMNFKKLSLGLVAATMLVATPVMAQERQSGTRRAGLLLSELTVPHRRLWRESGAPAGSSYYRQPVSPDATRRCVCGSTVG